MGRPPRALIGGAAAAAAAGVAAQFVRVRNGYPAFADLETSGEYGDPRLPRVDIVMLGDSTLTGAGLDDPADAWVLQVMPQLAADYHVRLTNLGEGGARIGDVIARQLSPALARPWDVAFVSVGANDTIRMLPMSVMERRLAHVVDALLEVSAEVVLAGHGDMSSPPRMVVPFNWAMWTRSWRADRGQARVAARRDRVSKVPMWEHRAGWRRDDIWAADLFHPNRAGQALWAASIYPTLREAVDRAVARRG